jgi:hypothetical protein
MASRYVHLSGRGHVNAVLETEGMEIEHTKHDSTPLIELSRCPNCDEPIDTSWVQCPKCQFILDEKLGISRQDHLEELEAKIEEYEKAQGLVTYLVNEVEKLTEKVKQLEKGS